MFLHDRDAQAGKELPLYRNTPAIPRGVDRVPLVQTLDLRASAPVFG